MNQPITVEAHIEAPIEKVWTYWTQPEHIMNWNAASDDWHTPYAENNLQIGQSFLSRMAAKDGSASFDFKGTYTAIVHHQLIAYTMEDGRKVRIEFEQREQSTHVTEQFDPESENPIELQEAGWQAILNHFKRYTENH
ncbi:MAG: SRPBCC family protein [Bacteroidia bacterium]|jgi:uncharacterized protein YndB with AHSA1/START domain|nr:SRPBCC family protein [Bacteroidia bacterium]